MRLDKPMEFQAGHALVGQKCYLCNKAVKADDMVRFYGGPYLVHTICLDDLMEKA